MRARRHTSRHIRRTEKNRYPGDPSDDWDKPTRILRAAQSALDEAMLPFVAEEIMGQPSYGSTYLRIRHRDTLAVRYMKFGHTTPDELDAQRAHREHAPMVYVRGPNFVVMDALEGSTVSSKMEMCFSALAALLDRSAMLHCDPSIAVQFAVSEWTKMLDSLADLLVRMQSTTAETDWVHGQLTPDCVVVEEESGRLVVVQWSSAYRIEGDARARLLTDRRHLALCMVALARRVAPSPDVYKQMEDALWQHPAFSCLDRMDKTSGLTSTPSPFASVSSCSSGGSGDMDMYE